MPIKLSREEEFFLLESNRIEGITRPLNEREKKAFVDFMECDEISIQDMEDYVKAVQPNAVLRDRVGLNVRVGNHYPPVGGPEIRTQLAVLLDEAQFHGVDNGLTGLKSFAYKTHLKYETLHPFTDGNGRSGRMLWYWMMEGSSIGFLHRFYYQTLDNLK